MWDEKRITETGHYSSLKQCHTQPHIQDFALSRFGHFHSLATSLSLSISLLLCFSHLPPIRTPFAGYFYVCLAFFLLFFSFFIHCSPSAAPTHFSFGFPCCNHPQHHTPPPLALAFSFPCSLLLLMLICYRVIILHFIHVCVSFLLSFFLPRPFLFFLYRNVVFFTKKHRLSPLPITMFAFSSTIVSPVCAFYFYLLIFLFASCCSQLLFCNVRFYVPAKWKNYTLFVFSNRMRMFWCFATCIFSLLVVFALLSVVVLSFLLLYDLDIVIIVIIFAIAIRLYFHFNILKMKQKNLFYSYLR